MRRYPILQLLSALYKVAAVVGFLLSVLVFALVVNSPSLLLNRQLGASGYLLSLAPSCLFLFVATMVCMTLYAAGELINLLIDIEFNTRRPREDQRVEVPRRFGN